MLNHIVPAPAIKKPAPAPAPATEALVETPGTFEEVALEALGSGDAALEHFADLDGSIAGLERLLSAGQAHGFSAGLMAYADPEQLLCTTVLGVPSVESLNSELLPAAPDHQIAVEGILGALREKIASWAKAAWDAIVTVGSKAVAIAKKGLEKVAAFAGWLKDKTWDAAKAAKATIKAHPYATAALAVAAVAGVGVFAYAVWGGGLPTTAAAATAFMDKVRTALAAFKSPGYALKLDANGTISGIGAKLPSAAQEKAAAALGWSKDKVTEIVSKLSGGLKGSGDKLASVFETIKAGVRALIGKLPSGAEAADSLRAIRQAIKVALHATWAVVRAALVGAVMLVLTTLDKLRPLYSAGVAA